MQVKNDLNLLEPIFEALAHDNYDAGDSDITPSVWIDSPRIAQLTKAHKHEIEESIKDRTFALLGTAVHVMLERAAGDGVITEERVFYDHSSGLRISGAIDLQILEEGNLEKIVDYKTSSVWTYILNESGLKPEWISQLNSYRYIIEKAKPEIKVSALYILVIFRDWRASDAKKRADYPSSPIMQIQVPLWSWKETEAYVAERLELHQNAAYSALIGEPLPKCSSVQMWEQKEKYAVFKNSTAKRAQKLCNSKDEAIAWASDRNLNGAGFIEHRPGKRTRCEDWCKVSQWCDQNKEYLENKDDNI